jgi:hypothetical protein
VLKVDYLIDMQGYLKLELLSTEILKLKLILVAPNPDLYSAFQQSFDYFPNVEIVNNYFEWLNEFDCLVSPGNSFGYPLGKSG